jgi:hypothetical protein
MSSGPKEDGISILQSSASLKPQTARSFTNSSSGRRVGSLVNRPDVWNTHPVVVFSPGSLVDRFPGKCLSYRGVPIGQLR